MRGVQIIEPVGSKEDIGRAFFYSWDRKRKYASFLAHDWRHNRVAEISSAPDKTANYYSTSDLPFEMSPAFFHPDVILKYKADSEKYTIKDRSITCRATWELQSIDSNTEGQVHAYIRYLRDLPYKEQLHWLAYNEAPKGTISRRAITNDFEGNWDLEYHALESLRSALQELKDQRVPWWTLRNGSLIDKVNYPVTTSADEWSEELLHLDQLIVEGFEEHWLRSRAEKLGRSPQSDWRSLKLLEECLLGFGFEPGHATGVIASFRQVHHYRSKLKGHAQGDDAIEIKRKAIKEFGSYNEHFRKLCSDCDSAIRTIGAAFKRYGGTPACEK